MLATVVAATAIVQALPEPYHTSYRPALPALAVVAAVLYIVAVAAVIAAQRSLTLPTRQQTLAHVNEEIRRLEGERDRLTRRPLPRPRRELATVPAAPEE
jgi:hypothetical protein